MSDGLKEQINRERDWRHAYGGTCREWLVDEGCACSVCSGSGYVTYGSTATWRGGVGGQTMTNDVCSTCWGSGIINQPWPSHRELDRLRAESERMREALIDAVDMLSGATFEVMRVRGQYIDRKDVVCRARAALRANGGKE